MEETKILDQLFKDIEKEIGRVEEQQKKVKYAINEAYLNGYKKALVNIGYNILNMQCEIVVKYCKKIRKEV